MFRKNFRVKNNCQLKSSDKKKLVTNILSTFPCLTETELLETFPAKENVQHVKGLSNDGSTVSVYCCKGQPLIFSKDHSIFPTTYFLWLHPTIVHSFTVSKFVLSKLCSGADLMVPGIIKDSDPSYGEVNDGEIVSINLPENKAAVAVGVTLMNSEVMESLGRGKAVSILHTMEDSIFRLATVKISIPTLTIPVTPEIEENNRVEDINSISTPITEELSQLSVNDEASIDDKNVVSLDDILLNAFLHTVKTLGNKMELPILTNLFNKNYLLKSIPASQDFDIRKTKYKKLSTFLIEMEKEGIIKLFTSPKDVQSIVAIDTKHHLLSNYTYIFQDDEDNKEETKELPTCLEIIEGFIVNSSVLKLFSKCGHGKGDEVSAQEVRKMITNYVKKNDLQDPVLKEQVILDHILAKVTQCDSAAVEWKWLIETIMSNMGNYYVVKKNGTTIASGRGKIPLIDIYIRIRSGHKKVTVADYLESYGVDVQELSRICQHALAASTTVNKQQNTSKKGLQFQIQGCHIPYITKLLTDKYGIPKKYIADGS